MGLHSAGPRGLPRTVRFSAQGGKKCVWFPEEASGSILSRARQMAGDPADYSCEFKSQRVEPSPRLLFRSSFEAQDRNSESELKVAVQARTAGRTTNPSDSH